MTCSTKLTSLNYLKKQNIISDVRIILNEDLFNIENERDTMLAVRDYGLKVDGKLLYDVETFTTALGRESIYQRTKISKLAVPNEAFFSELDKLAEIKKSNDKVALVAVNARPGKNLRVYQSKTKAIYTQNKEKAINVNKLLQYNTKGYLNSKEDSIYFKRFSTEFTNRKGDVFNINDTSHTGLAIQMSFYEFLQNKGFNGLEFYDNNELRLIPFPKSQLEIEYADQETNVVEPVTQETIAEENQKSVLTESGWYHPQELEKLYLTYTPEQINAMVEENSANATAEFNKVLYPDEFNNDTFATNEEVNNQLYNCK